MQVIGEYHQRSKHQIGAFAPGPTNHPSWSSQPLPRSYSGSPRHALDRDAPLSRGLVYAARVSALLFHSLALSGKKLTSASEWTLRVAPSSGNLHPVEAYVVAPPLGPGFPAKSAVFHYCANDHVLELRATCECPQKVQAEDQTGILVVLSAVHWREVWKYGLRGWRYTALDAGHAAAALATAAAALGWDAELEMMTDSEAAALVGLNRPEFASLPAEELESIMTVLKIGGTPPALSELEYHGIPNSIARTRCPEEAWLREIAAVDKVTGQEWSGPLVKLHVVADGAQVARKRRSALGFHASELPGSVMQRILKCVVEVEMVAAIFVHRVQEYVPGLYMAGSEPALATMKEKLPAFAWTQVLPNLALLHAADVRDMARQLACDQDVADGGALYIMLLADLQKLAFGPAAYRQCHLEAGIAVHALYLQAELLGYGGTGTGAFYDDEVHRVLGLPDDRFQAIYGFAMGIPKVDNRLLIVDPYVESTPSQVPQMDLISIEQKSVCWCS